MSHPDLMTPEEVASLLGVSKTTLRRMRDRREGPPYSTPSRRVVRYSRQDVEAFIESHRHGATTPEGGVNP